ncbi:MAG TPA: desulfoferrodoxin [bacterium]|nr:desulfoferrodoxin [bacterium]HPP86270.1 desulfoferrodoxin [bacterium]
MTVKLEIYKCNICGNIVEITHSGGGTLVCCNQPMTLQKENTVEASVEKHKPVVEKISNGSKVKVGSVAHPMEDKHYIEWIEIINGDYVNRKYLKPGDAPEADFYLTPKDSHIVRAYCNLHGLWKK